jgi:hypothetical protein
VVHRNLTDNALDPNDTYSVGAGGRIKLSKRVTFNVEYYYVIPPAGSKRVTPNPTYNPLSVGFDIETGGHVFQLFLTNSTPITEMGFITDTEGSWKNGGVHIAFNISRVFTLKAPPIFRDEK